QPPEAQRWQGPVPQASYPTAPYQAAPSASAHQPTAPFAQAAPAPVTTAQAERPRRRTGLVVGSLVAAALLGGVAGFGGGVLADLQQDGQTQSAGSGSSATGGTVSDPGTGADVAAAAGPSVVTVQAVSQAGSGEGSGVVIAGG
ncbi:hypothetical protein, partial [Escherichia coli]|uniref:hypothetical protein n=1 Tax=Escherichia coli TaxID=562 RepID=UPI003DA1F170